MTLARGRAPAAGSDAPFPARAAPAAEQLTPVPHAHSHRAGDLTSAPAHDRAVRTLMSWDIEVDEAMFLGGLEKGPFLQVFAPDFFFDDQLTHLSQPPVPGQAVTSTPGS